jgi:hypothetical protein
MASTLDASSAIIGSKSDAMDLLATACDFTSTYPSNKGVQENLEPNSSNTIAQSVNNCSTNTAPLCASSFCATIFAHPLSGNRQAYDIRTWQQFECDSPVPVVWPIMWGGRHHHFKLALNNGHSFGNLVLELWWRPSRGGPLEIFPDQVDNIFTVIAHFLLASDP